MAATLIQLHERIFVRGHTLGMNPENLLYLVQAHQIGLVVNVALRPDNAFAAGCRTIGIRYKHVPLHDSQTQPIAPEVPGLIEEVADYAKRIGNVLVHCDSGWNRSNLIAIGALTRLTDELPVHLITTAREGRPKTLKNPAFELYVLGLHKCDDVSCINCGYRAELEEFVNGKATASR